MRPPEKVFLSLFVAIGAAGIGLFAWSLTQGAWWDAGLSVWISGCAFGNAALVWAGRQRTKPMVVRFVADTRAYEAGLARLAEAISTSALCTKVGAEIESYHLRLRSLYTGEDWEKARALFDGKSIELAKYTPLNHSEACEQAYRWTFEEMEASK